MPLPRHPISWVHFLKLKLSEIGALPIISAALTWLVLAPRLVPTNDFDRGIFVSVAERLLAGDILYAQVYDNKEPLFYYFVAGQRWIGPIAEFLAELLLFVVAAASAYSIACRLASQRAAFVIAFVGIPIILTGAFYWAGYTHLPGISLCLAAFALSLRGRLAAAGVALGLLAFTKLIMLPMALALVMCALAFERFLPAIRLWVSLVLTLVVGSTLLMIRSEFYPFLDVMRLNFTYSHNQLVASFADRLQMLASENLTVILLSIVVGMLVAFLARSPNDRALALMGSATLIALTLALLTLALAGVWNHHAQILYVPAALVAISLAPRLVTALNQSQAVFAVLLVVCFSLLLGGVTSLEAYTGNPFHKWADKISALGSVSPETRRLLAQGASGSYARLGKNDDEGHAAGLQSWSLVCPKFHQYPFDSQESLDRVVACIPSAPTLIVENSFAKEEGWPAWNVFVGKVEELISSSYQCDAEAGLRICSRMLSRGSR